MLLTITLSLKNNIENFDITTEKGASSAFEFVGVASGKCGFTTLRISKYKKPKFLAK